jgi:putative transposase
VLARAPFGEALHEEESRSHGRGAPVGGEVATAGEADSKGSQAVPSHLLQIAAQVRREGPGRPAGPSTQGQEGVEPPEGGGERGFIVAYALEHPSLGPREIAARLVDREGKLVSESTVYRVLREAGLVKPPQVQGFPAEKEYRVKATGPNQLWHTDASYFFVAGWGYYYLITVLDDYSRMVLAWRVRPSMGTTCIIEVVQDAVEFTGLLTVPVEHGPALLTDNGPGFPSRAIEEFVKVRAMKHIVASPYHPQTNGKLERYHRTAKANIILFVYHSPEALEQAMGEFVRHYNYERYHEALGNVTPADMYYGRREAILARRKEMKRTCLESRRAANLGVT